MSFLAVFFLTLLADIDFSAAEPGAIRDKLSPRKNPGFARTRDIYSRRLGDAVNADPRIDHPSYAFGRDGEFSALRSGTARKEIPGLQPDPITLPEHLTLPVEGPSTQLFWFYVYDTPELAAHARLLESSFGYKIGFRLEWTRAHWMPSGGITFVYGDGKTSKSVRSLSKKDCLPGMWHQVAIVNDGKEFEVFLDGDSLGKSPGNYLKGNNPLRLRLAVDLDEVSFKTDSYRLYSSALSPEDIASDWRKGNPSNATNGDETREYEKLARIKNATAGIFAVGEKIEFTAGGKTVKTLSFPRSGIFEETVCGRRFPICVVPARGVKTGIGAVDLVNRQPELMALGIKKTLVRIPWKNIEPEKNAYDWETIDAIDDECRKRNVEAVFVVTDEPDWYLKAPAANEKAREKFRAYAEARYKTKLADPQSVGIANASDGKSLAREIERLRAEGKRHIFVNTRPPEWMGRYAPSFEGRPGQAVLALGEFLAR